jgi:hypothetical protein
VKSEAKKWKTEDDVEVERVDGGWRVERLKKKN